MATVRKLPTGKYQVSYIDPRTRKRHRPSFDTKKDARDFKKKVEAEITLFKLSPSAVSDTLLKDAINRFLEQIRTTRRSRTFERYREHFRNFRRFVDPSYGDNLLLSDIRPSHIEQFKAARLTLGRSETTVANEMTSLGTLMRWAMRMGMITENVVPLVPKPKTRRQPLRVYTLDEWSRILDAAGNRRFYYLWLYWTGSRLRDPLVIQEKHIKLEDGTFLYQNLKTGEEEDFPLHPSLVEGLRERLIGNPDAYIFQAERDLDHRNRNALLDEMHSIQSRLGIPRGGIHDIKRTVLTHLGQAGINPYVVQRIGHHKSLETTMDYLNQPELDRIRAAFRELGDPSAP